MQNTLIALFLFSLLGCTQSHIPKILTQDYNFITSDSEIIKFGQSSDTLYHYYINQACSFQPDETKYKIIAVNQIGDIKILKIKHLSASSLGIDKGYSLLVFKNIDNKHFEYLGAPLYNLTRNQLDTIQIESLSLDKRRFLTYYSDSYLKELSVLKRVTTIDAVKEIISSIQGNNLKRISFTDDELNKACIKKGYNPIGAGLTIDSIMRPR